MLYYLPLFLCCAATLFIGMMYLKLHTKYMLQLKHNKILQGQNHRLTVKELNLDGNGMIQANIKFVSKKDIEHATVSDLDDLL